MLIVLPYICCYFLDSHNNRYDRKSLELTAVVSEGNIGGTPDYCSPEQWFATVDENDKLNDGRADIFLLESSSMKCLQGDVHHLMIRINLI
jgi:hypothetical protein